MAKRQINPNRMELLKLKKQLVTARRGHKLLKDKRDELMRQFLDLVRANEKLRLRVEKLLAEANREMVLARAVMQPQIIETALLAGKENLTLDIDSRNITSVQVPVFTTPFDVSGIAENLPYGLAGTSGELDQVIASLQEAFAVMLELAEVEKAAQLIADEIERTRRRVNSLEYILIPELQETIRSISMKMEENERGNLTRLMKVKEMIVAQALQEARLRDEAAFTESGSPRH